MSACGLLEGGGWWRNRRPQGTGLHGQAVEPGQLLGCLERSVGGRHLWAPIGLLHTVETQVQHSWHNAAALLRTLSEEVNVTSSAFSLKECDVSKRVLGCVFSGRGEKYVYVGSKCLLGGIAADLTVVSSLRLELRILEMCWNGGLSERGAAPHSGHLAQVSARAFLSVRPLIIPQALRLRLCPSLTSASFYTISAGPEETTWRQRPSSRSHEMAEEE